MQSNHSQIFISLTLLTFVGFAGWIVANDFSIYVPSSEVVLGSSAEQCDDGNNLDGDGCSRTCQNENLCDGSFPDGALNGGEECDDGNGLNTDACDNYCRITICGDRIVQSPNGRGQAEACDDGNREVGDGCNSVCVLEIADECGNWVTDGTEDCDDGSRCSNTGDPCYSNDDCYGGGTCGTYAGDGCGGTGGTPPENCSIVGDEDCDGDYDCDDSDCTGHPSCAAGCGNSKVESGEECDDGNTTSGDGCSEYCLSESGCPMCDVCENAYSETWSLTLNGSGVTGECGTSVPCTVFDGTYTLRLTDVMLSCSNCKICSFCWIDNYGTNECPFITPPPSLGGGNTWSLTLNRNLGRWELVTGTCEGYPAATYYKSTSEWNCTGVNTMNLDGALTHEFCSSWPTSVTLTPSGDFVCQASSTCGNGVVEYNTVTDTYERCDDGNTTNGDGCNSSCDTEWNYYLSEICNNNTDDDGDGLKDCLDPDCASGPVCSGGGGGGGTPEDCDAAGDEDSDGDENCADSDCPDTTSCGANGLQCSSGSCECPGGSSESNCTDTNDNDCDGSTDCSDSDCSADPACSGTPEDCDAAGDEDSDGDENCADSDCPNGTTCGTNGLQCSSGSCTCPGGSTESNCSDSTDNDCDGDVDCADSNCSGMTCGANGRECSGSSCVCTGGGTEICDSGSDDDCDGDTDCDDSDCSGDPACTGGGSEICDNGMDDDGDYDEDCDDSDCPTEYSETYCDDGYDNDCDGDYDCDDMDCMSDEACTGGGSEICDNGMDDDGDYDEDCDDSDCPTEFYETDCDDGYDNDCDGDYDCDDYDDCMYDPACSGGGSS